jgi:lysophospholipase L1-like esterase
VAASRRRKLAFGVAAAAVALLAAEGVARLAYRGRWPDPFVFDPALGWAHRPGWTGEVRAGVRASFDALGLRVAEADVGRTPAPKTARRVLLLGDSVAFGYGLEHEETIARALERTGGLEVLNAGVEGHGPEQSARLLARLAPELRPDVALLLLCLRNDLGVPPLDPLAVARDLAPADALAAGLLDRSALAYALARLRRRREVAAWREAPPAGGPVAFRTPAEVAALPAAERSALFAALGQQLRAFRDAALAAGAAPVVAVCPEADLLEGRVPRALVVDPVLAEAAAAGLLAVVDLLPLRPELREKDGVHPTAQGAATIAGGLLPVVGGR